MVANPPRTISHEAFLRLVEHIAGLADIPEPGRIYHVEIDPREFTVHWLQPDHEGYAADGNTRRVFINRKLIGEDR